LGIPELVAALDQLSLKHGEAKIRSKRAIFDGRINDLQKHVNSAILKLQRVKMIAVQPAQGALLAVFAT
jgi:hypothetical protein